MLKTHQKTTKFFYIFYNYNYYYYFHYIDGEKKNTYHTNLSR